MYALLYRSKYTEWEWQHLIDFDGINAQERAENTARNYAESNMKNCEFGVVHSRVHGDWREKTRIPIIINRQGRDVPIPASVGGIINTFYKPGNDAR